MRYSIILFFLFSLTAAFQTNAQSKTSAFDKVSVDGNIEVILRPDNMHDVDPIVNKDDVTYDIQNGTLIINHVNDSEWSDPAKVTVNFTALTSIKASNQAVVSCEGLMSADSLSLLAHENARFEMIVGCGKLTAFISNSSEMTLSGKTDQFYAELLDNSILDASTLEATVAHIKTNTESAATVFALEGITATAMTNSTIKVLGDPKSENVSEQSGGTVQ